MKKNVLCIKGDKIMSEAKYEKTYKSDMYIMIPFTSKVDSNIVTSTYEDDVTKEFLKDIERSSTYQCDNKITKDMERYFIGKTKIACLNFNRDKTVIDKEDVYMFLTKHAKTNIYVLTIMNLKNEFSPTQIQDQVTTDNIFVYDENEEKISIYDYIKNKYNLELCGKAKTLLSISNYPENNLEFECMLASEVFDPYCNNDENFRINSSEIRAQSKDNFSQYAFCDLYASKSAVVYLLKDFQDKNDLLNIKNEVAILFIMEIIMFQEASVLRTNNRIVEQLSHNGLVTLKFIEELYQEFGKTIRLWNRYVFKYETVQNIALKINEAFKTQNTLDEYYKNQEFLEHIVNLRDIQASNKESKILNFIVLILTIIQVVPVIFEFIDWIFNTNLNMINIFDFKYLISLSTTILIIILIILLKRKMNDNNKRKK